MFHLFSHLTFPVCQPGTRGYWWEYTGVLLCQSPSVESQISTGTRKQTMKLQYLAPATPAQLLTSLWDFSSKLPVGIPWIFDIKTFAHYSYSSGLPSHLLQDKACTFNDFWINISVFTDDIPQHFCRRENRAPELSRGHRATNPLPVLLKGTRSGFSRMKNEESATERGNWRGGDI